MKEVRFDQFDLKKVKLVKGGGLEVEYSTSETSGNGPEGPEIYGSTHKDKSTKFPHPDLTELLKQFKPMVARVFNFSFFRELVQHEDFNAKEEQSRIAERFYQEIIGKIEINGIALSGDGANCGCIVMASFLTEVNKNKAALNVPRIKFNSTTFGFEEEMQDLADMVKEETFKFLFENKVADPELFDNFMGDEEEAPDLFNQEEQPEEQPEQPEEQQEEIPDLPDMDIENEPVPDQEKSDEQREQEANDAE